MLESFKPALRMLGCAFALAIALQIFLLWWNNPRRKGARGEKLVADRLRKGLPDEYRILNDVYLPMPDGTTTQIDHVVVSQYGVFVVETKTYSGWIFGDGKSREWTQTFRRRKNRFQNPIRQNYAHICALADNLGLDKSLFVGVVAFNDGCTFKTAMPDGVVRSRRVAEHVLSYKTPRIGAERLDELVAAIVEKRGALGDGRIASHVDNLKRRHGG